MISTQRSPSPATDPILSEQENQQVEIDFEAVMIRLYNMEGTSPVHLLTEADHWLECAKDLSEYQHYYLIDRKIAAYLAYDELFSADNELKQLQPTTSYGKHLLHFMEARVLLSKLAKIHKTDPQNAVELFQQFTAKLEAVSEGEEKLPLFNFLLLQKELLISTCESYKNNYESSLQAALKARQISRVQQINYPYWQSHLLLLFNYNELNDIDNVKKMITEIKGKDIPFPILTFHYQSFVLTTLQKNCENEKNRKRFFEELGRTFTFAKELQQHRLPISPTWVQQLLSKARKSQGSKTNPLPVLEPVVSPKPKRARETFKKEIDRPSKKLKLSPSSSVHNRDMTNESGSAQPVKNNTQENS